MKVAPENLKRLLIAEEKVVDEAIRKAVRHALLTHKRAGVPVSSWRDGKVVMIPADEIQVEELSAEKK